MEIHRAVVAVRRPKDEGGWTYSVGVFFCQAKECFAHRFNKRDDSLFTGSWGFSGRPGCSTNDGHGRRSASISRTCTARTSPGTQPRTHRKNAPQAGALVSPLAR